MISWRKHPEYGDFLRSFIPGHSEAEIADAFEREFGIRLTVSQIANAKTRLGVRSGTVGGRFEPGASPANKGLPWAEWMPAESAERCRATQFKRGGLPWTTREVGEERVSKDGYVEVHVAQHRRERANDQWVPKHRLVWEEANGRALRPDEIVLFANGDRRDFRPENLVAVTRAENQGLTKIGRPYADRETLMDALKTVRLNRAIASAEKRPRRCRSCGREFEPRHPRQRRCDECLAAAPSPNFGWGICPVCGERFKKACGRQRYCSAGCRRAANHG